MHGLLAYGCPSFPFSIFSQIFRIVFKTLLGYTDFTECKDLARLTVQTPGLVEMDGTTVALLDCKQLTYARMKDRWPEAYDVGKTGGYRQVWRSKLLRLLPLL